MRLTASRAADEAGEAHVLTVASPLSVGQFVGKWCSYSAPPDLPYDQRQEDGGSLVFDTDLLDDRVEILGAPVVELELAADQSVGMVAVRLSDVAPDGRATRVSYGMLNLTHRTGHDDPQVLSPGERYQVTVRLNGVAQAFPPGHRIQVSGSTSYWPLAWPPPEPVQLTVFTEHSRLLLPIRQETGSEQDDVRRFGEPEGAPPLSTSERQPGGQRWTVSRDLIDYTSALKW